MKTIRTTFLVSMLLVLSGCMMVPVSPGPRGYYGAPAYYGPSIGVGIYGGDGGGDRGRDYGDDHDEGRGGDHHGGHGGDYGRGHGGD